MSLNIGQQVIPQVILGVNNLNKIMLGTVEIFPNLVPVSVYTPISLVDRQLNITSDTVSSIPVDSTLILPGDTVILTTRATAAQTPTLSLDDIPLNRLVTQTNTGNGANAAIDMFVATAAQSNVGTLNITRATSVTLITDILIFRGGFGLTGLAQVIGINSGTGNAASVNINATATDQEALFVGINTNTPAATITNLNTANNGSNIPQVSTVVPRQAMASVACIVDTPGVLQLTVAPAGAQIIFGGVWLRGAP